MLLLCCCCCCCCCRCCCVLLFCCCCYDVVCCCCCCCCYVAVVVMLLVLLLLVLLLLLLMILLMMILLSNHTQHARRTQHANHTSQTQAHGGLSHPFLCLFFDVFLLLLFSLSCLVLGLKSAFKRQTKRTPKGTASSSASAVFEYSMVTQDTRHG